MKDRIVHGSTRIKRIKNLTTENMEKPCKLICDSYFLVLRNGWNTIEYPISNKEFPIMIKAHLPTKVGLLLQQAQYGVSRGDFLQCLSVKVCGKKKK